MLDKNTSYDELHSAIFADDSEIKGENYQEKKKLAEDVLTTAHEWLQSEYKPAASGRPDDLHKRRTRRECKQYIKQNYVLNNEGSQFIFGGIILTVILNLVISWVLKRLMVLLFGD